MSTSTRRYLTWVEDHAALALRGDVEALAALKTFAAVSGGKVKAAAVEAIQECEAEAEGFSFAVDVPDTAVLEIDDVEFSVLVG